MTRRWRGDFDITKEETFGNIPVGQLAYKLFADLILRNAISAEEVEGLKSKAFTQKQFSGMYYPVLANQRNDNQGNSANIRYRKQPLIFEGSEVYITTQWFEINRQELITWYHDHLRIAKWIILKAVPVLMGTAFGLSWSACVNWDLSFGVMKIAYSRHRMFKIIAIVPLYQSQHTLRSLLWILGDVCAVHEIHQSAQRAQW